MIKKINWEKFWVAFGFTTILITLIAFISDMTEINFFVVLGIGAAGCCAIAGISLGAVICIDKFQEWAKSEGEKTAKEQMKG